MSKKYIFIGAAGSGKSLIANQVFTKLKKKHLNVELVPEWIRYDININGPMQSIWEQYRTYQKQKELEDSVPETFDYVMVDSGVLTPVFYANLYFNHRQPRERLVLQDMYKFLLDDVSRYEKIFFLPSHFTYSANANILNDGTRFQTQNDIDILNDQMDMFFCRLHKFDNVYKIDCPLEIRCKSVLKIIMDK